MGFQGGVTRKTNRLWSRIEPAISEVKDSNVTGVYKLGSRWGSDLGHVHAGSAVEAKNVGLTMFAHVLDKNEKTRLSAEIVSRSNIEDVLKFNKKIFNKARATIKSHHDEIETAKGNIEKQKQRLEAMMTLETLLLDKSQREEDEKSK